MVVFITDFESGSYLPPIGVTMGASTCDSFVRPIVVFPKVTQEPVRVSMRPISSKKNILGDRDCIHHNFKGDIYRFNGIRYYQEVVKYASSPKPIYDMVEVARWVDITVSGALTGRCVIRPFQNYEFEPPVYKYTPTEIYQIARYTWYGSFSSDSVRLLVQQQFAAIFLSDGTFHHSYCTEDAFEWSGFNSWNVPSKYKSKRIFTKNVTTPHTPVEYTTRDRHPADPKTELSSSSFVSLGSGSYTTGWTPPSETREEKITEGSSLLSNLSYLSESTLSRNDISSFWEDLCVQAIQSAKHLDINTGMFAADLYKIRTAIKPFISLTKGLSAKNLASAYLSWHYGLRLSYLDGRALITEIVSSTKSIQRTKLYSSCRSRLSRPYEWKDPSGNKGTLSMNYKVYYNPRDDNFSKVIGAFQSWDLFPSLSNVWDVIPYSFVVDWFVPIQDALERIDSSTYAATLDVIMVCRSTRIETVVKPVTISRYLGLSRWKENYINANLTHIRYHRENLSVLDRPRFRIGQPSEFRNYAELTAILVQKT